MMMKVGGMVLVCSLVASLGMASLAVAHKHLAHDQVGRLGATVRRITL